MLNNLKIRAAVNTKISVFLICDKAIIYLLLFNLHDCTLINKILTRKSIALVKVNHAVVINVMLLLRFQPDKISLKRNVTGLIVLNQVIIRRIAVQK